jgi:hypothetical protein
MKNAFTPFFKPYDAPKGKRVYVSGPMTGYDEYNFPAFAEAAKGLRELGYAVCSPAETDQFLGLGVMTHAQYLRFDFARVLEADFLVALDGWERSMGAISEILMAVRMGTKVWRWSTFNNYDLVTYDDVAQAVSDMYIGKADTTTEPHPGKVLWVEENA